MTMTTRPLPPRLLPTNVPWSSHHHHHRTLCPNPRPPYHSSRRARILTTLLVHPSAPPLSSKSREVDSDKGEEHNVEVEQGRELVDGRTTGFSRVKSRSWIRHPVGGEGRRRMRRYEHK
ncbi:hypothetical protein GYMLUDRAFT_915218 [Collybiopsis luxurians FD-317 M1]|nr:hypothetical protein GYMLUDRAFT_915218 [Collybiopsis luxurians FD-317 M1]